MQTAAQGPFTSSFCQKLQVVIALGPALKDGEAYKEIIQIVIPR